MTITPLEHNSQARSLKMKKKEIERGDKSKSSLRNRGTPTKKTINHWFYAIFSPIFLLSTHNSSNNPTPLFPCKIFFLRFHFLFFFFFFLVLFLPLRFFFSSLRKPSDPLHRAGDRYPVSLFLEYPLPSIVLTTLTLWICLFSV